MSDEEPDYIKLARARHNMHNSALVMHNPFSLNFILFGEWGMNGERRAIVFGHNNESQGALLEGRDEINTMIDGMLSELARLRDKETLE